MYGTVVGVKLLVESPCDHDGELVEVPELNEVRCSRCGEMAPTVEKHLGR